MYPLEYAKVLQGMHKMFKCLHNEVQCKSTIVVGTFVSIVLNYSQGVLDIDKILPKGYFTKAKTS